VLIIDMAVVVAVVVGVVVRGVVALRLARLASTAVAAAAAAAGGVSPRGHGAWRGEMVLECSRSRNTAIAAGSGGGQATAAGVQEERGLYVRSVGLVSPQGLAAIAVTAAAVAGVDGTVAVVLVTSHDRSLILSLSECKQWDKVSVCVCACAQHSRGWLMFPSLDAVVMRTRRLLGELRPPNIQSAHGHSHGYLEACSAFNQARLVCVLTPKEEKVVERTSFNCF
jgi:hypothetical protein